MTRDELRTDLILELLNVQNLNKLENGYKYYFVCHIKAENKIEECALYNFWKEVGIKINFQDNYDSGKWHLESCASLWLDKRNPIDKTTVSYYLWHPFQCEIAKKKRAIAYESFKAMLLNVDELYQLFVKLEQDVINNKITRNV